MNLPLKVAILKDGRRVYQVAQDAGLHPATLSHYLMEYRQPPEDHRNKIARALGCDVSDIFKIEG